MYPNYCCPTKNSCKPTDCCSNYQNSSCASSRNCCTADHTCCEQPRKRLAPLVCTTLGITSTATRKVPIKTTKGSTKKCCKKDKAIGNKFNSKKKLIQKGAPIDYDNPSVRSCISCISKQSQSEFNKTPPQTPLKEAPKQHKLPSMPTNQMRERNQINLKPSETFMRGKPNQQMASPMQPSSSREKVPINLSSSQVSIKEKLSQTSATSVPSVTRGRFPMNLTSSQTQLREIPSSTSGCSSARQRNIQPKETTIENKRSMTLLRCPSVDGKQLPESNRAHRQKTSDYELKRSSSNAMRQYVQPETCVQSSTQKHLKNKKNFEYQDKNIRIPMEVIAEEEEDLCQEKAEGENECDCDCDCDCCLKDRNGEADDHDGQECDNTGADEREAQFEQARYKRSDGCQGQDEKSLQDTCADFLNIVNDSVLDSVKKTVQSLLQQFFMRTMERIDDLCTRMMRNECLISKMYIDLMDKMNQQNEKSQLQFKCLCEFLIENKKSSKGFEPNPPPTRSYDGLDLMSPWNQNKRDYDQDSACCCPMAERHERKRSFPEQHDRKRNSGGETSIPIHVNPYAFSTTFKRQKGGQSLKLKADASSMTNISYLQNNHSPSLPPNDPVFCPEQGRNCTKQNTDSRNVKGLHSDFQLRNINAINPMLRPHRSDSSLSIT